MRYLYSIALLLLLASCKEEEKKKPADHTKAEWSFYKLEGHVKSVSERSYEAVGNWQKGSTRQEIASAHDTDMGFNEKGLLISEKKWLNGTMPFEESKFNGRGNEISKMQYINGQLGIKTEHSRDKAGNVTAIIRRNGDNTQLDRTAMTYNGKLLTEKKTFSNQDNPNGRTTYVYDKKGNLKGENLYLNTEYIQVKNLYEYDAQNRKISETRYSKDKTLYKTTFEYDGKNITKKETTGPDGAVTMTEKSSFDKEGNLLERYITDTYDRSVTHEAYKYDNNGNMLSYVISRNGSKEQELINIYDSHNNLTATKTANAKGEIIDSRTYTYEYDAKGNWTKKTVSLTDQPAFIVERKIEYFAE